MKINPAITLQAWRVGYSFRVIPRSSSATTRSRASGYAKDLAQLDEISSMSTFGTKRTSANACAMSATDP